MRQAAGSALGVRRRTDESDQSGCKARQNCDGPRYDSSSQEEAGETGTDDEGPLDSRPIGGGRLVLDRGPVTSSRRVVVSRDEVSGSLWGEWVRVREHWREVDYWLWMWHRHVRAEAKIALGAFLLVLLAGGGWFAADRLTSAHAGVAGNDSFVLETTVQKVVTVRERGKVVRKVVPVVKRVYLPRQTAIALRTRYEKQLVTTPGAVRVVSRLVTTYVPVLKTHLVKVNGKTLTVVRTQLVPTTRVETQLQTQTQVQTRVTTNQQTIVNQQTITNTNNRTVTQTLPAQTVTVTGPPVTGPTVTVTGPGETVPGPTETVFVTVPGPSQTVTVEVTVTAQ